MTYILEDQVNGEIHFELVWMDPEKKLYKSTVNGSEISLYLYTNSEGRLSGAGATLNPATATS